MEELALLAALVAVVVLAVLLHRARHELGTIRLLAYVYRDYIYESRGALLYLVQDALIHGGSVPAKATKLEVQVAQILLDDHKGLERIYNYVVYGAPTPHNDAG